MLSSRNGLYPLNNDIRLWYLSPICYRCDIIVGHRFGYTQIKSWGGCSMFAYQENKVGLNKWGGLTLLALLVGQFWINTRQMRATMGDDGVLREHQPMLIGLALVMYVLTTLLLGVILWGAVMLVRPQRKLTLSGVLLCNQLVWLPFGVESVVLLLMRQQERVTSVEIVLLLLAIGVFGWLMWQLKILRTWWQLTIIAILMAVIAFTPNVLSCA